MYLAESHKGSRKDIFHDSRNLVGGSHSFRSVSPKVGHGVTSSACRSVKKNHTIAVVETQMSAANLHVALGLDGHTCKP